MNQSALWKYCSLILLIVCYPILPSFGASDADVSIAFDKQSYCKDERRVIITVIDPQMNLQTSQTDEVEVKIWSSTDKAGMLVTLRETDLDNGIFEGDIRFVTDASAGVGLVVEEDDAIFATYNNLTATSTVSRTPVEPIKRIDVSNAKVYDAFDGNLLGVEFEGPKMIQADLENMYCYNSQAFFYTVQIKNENQYTVFLSWIKSTLERDQSAEAAIQWMPKTAGNFTVEIFVWDSLIDPQPLSEVYRTEVMIQ